MSVTREQIIDALKTVYDPEIPVNIWDLGLVYDIEISPSQILITMTFTSPTCPMMEDILAQVHDAVVNVSDGMDVRVNLVWEPQWDLSRMSETARLELDLTEGGW